jgi:hypothetical protein
MKALGVIFFLIILACALLASNEHKKFELRIDAQSPGVWPKYALALPRFRPASAWFQSFEVTLPPVEFQHGATAWPVAFAEQAGIDAICGGKNEFVACATVGGGWMALPNPCQPRFRGEAFAATACHEVGHLNGWEDK